MKSKNYLLVILFILFELGNSAYSQYTKLLDFELSTTGASPMHGALLYEGTFLYGMARSGGVNGNGTIFKIMPDGAGFSKLFDFETAISGGAPEGSLITDGTFLYGMTTAGGTNGFGTIFKIMPDGTGYVKLLDFTGAANGKNPHGSLLFDGTFLYGMTEGGGANAGGTIFKILPDGTGYFKLLDFNLTDSGSVTKVGE